MAVQETVTGFAVAVVREDGRWRCGRLDDTTLTELDTAITELRKLRSTGAVFGLLAVDDEFFVIIRPSPGGAALFLSDAAAALDYDIAADVLDLLRAEAPDDDDDVVWPVGDLEILADVGMPEPELEVIVNEIELYPDEQLQMIAQRCGFADEYAAVLDEL
ncbi:tRNA adenosine deaminase-associated protein [Saccharomonospora piscinae]|uniref:tRNA adenosine deaminase n=1 Tax=Saccharomonospora piscinae TaxID=687388 RepID=A0A1V9A7P5_SACPI|nr:tRNA adenosine deaminase-associated protein [Saccharomonospora piscinae]OQO92954.1 tRNA adenosine deaminase [Saccharomonospora piscinae]TLW93091.1 tRNA adenosine deaminase [Saccharomonospora piscinae]